jgi:hypothetical protein
VSSFGSKAAKSMSSMFEANKMWSGRSASPVPMQTSACVKPGLQPLSNGRCRCCRYGRAVGDSLAHSDLRRSAFPAGEVTCIGVGSYQPCEACNTLGTKSIRAHSGTTCALDGNRLSSYRQTAGVNSFPAPVLGSRLLRILTLYQRCAPLAVAAVAAWKVHGDTKHCGEGFKRRPAAKRLHGPYARHR